MPLSIIQDGPFQAFISSIAPWPFHPGAEGLYFQAISSFFNQFQVFMAGHIAPYTRQTQKRYGFPLLALSLPDGGSPHSARPLPTQLSTLLTNPSPSLPAAGVHENGYRPVVDQGNLHVRAKLPALHPAFQQIRQFLLEQLIQRNGVLRPCSADEGGPVPFRVEACSVNWLTTSALPPVSLAERFIFPSASEKMRMSAASLASQHTSSSVSASSMPARISRPGPVLPAHTPPMCTAASVTR